MRSAEREARELERRELAALGAAAKNASEGEAAEDAAFRTAFSVASIQDRDQLRCISAPVGRMYPRELSVTCPPGIGAGTTVLVHSPDGRISQARMRARVSHPREGYRLTRFPPDSQVVVPTGVTVGGVFGVPIPPTELQLAYERAESAKEEEGLQAARQIRIRGVRLQDCRLRNAGLQDSRVQERLRRLTPPKRVVRLVLKVVVVVPRAGARCSYASVWAIARRRTPYGIADVPGVGYMSSQGESATPGVRDRPNIANRTSRRLSRFLYIDRNAARSEEAVASVLKSWPRRARRSRCVIRCPRGRRHS